MKRKVRSLVVLLTAASTLLTGCAPSRPFYFFDDGRLTHYKGAATEIEYPDVEVASFEDVSQAQEPLTVANNEPQEFWDLTLEEAVQNALANSKVMRNLGGTPVTVSGLQTANINSARLLQQADAITTVYTPALRDADPRFGTEAALSAFDAQVTSSLFWSKNDRPVNVNLGFNPALAAFQQRVFMQDTTAFTTQVGKTSASGSQFFLRNNTNYEWNNTPSNLFPSIWTTNVEAEFRHPLLQGAGVDFNRIAGPNSVAGLYTGVVLARINTDIALAEFEAGVRNLVSDVENAYWNLYFAYRRLDANVAGRDSSLQTWRKVHAMAQAGAADAAQEAQSREQYFLFRAQVEQALSDMYSAESSMRYLMGIAATDGRLIRPADEPTTAKVNFDWGSIHEEALARSAELRRQRWAAKRAELSLVASKNFLLPRLDASALYRWRGLGDDLISSTGGGPSVSNAWQNLLGGNFQEWQMGFNFQMPIGFRQGLTAVRHAELQLARERALVQEQELEVSHLLSESIRNLDRTYMLSQTNFNRRAAAKRQVEAVQQNYEVGRITLDQLLDAQRRLADAESAYFQALADYNRAIAGVHYRKGSLLEYNAVYLAEGPWASKAYFDAEERARKRDAGHFIDYGFTRPKVFSRGPIDQGAYGPAYEEELYYDEGSMASPDAISQPDGAPQSPILAPQDVVIPAVPEAGNLKLEAPAGTMPTPAPLEPSPMPTIEQPKSNPTPMARPIAPATRNPSTATRPTYDEQSRVGNESRATIRAVGYASPRDSGRASTATYQR